MASATRSPRWINWNSLVARLFSRHLPRRARPRVRLEVERLEDRQLLSTFVVNTTQDENDQDLPNDPDGPDGLMSLREAIVAANDNAGTDRIEFSIGSGAQTITLAADLPAITDTVTIEGRTQPGYLGTPLIEVNGAGQFAGLVITANNCTIGGLAVTSMKGDALQLLSDWNFIAGNSLGLALDGKTAVGSSGWGLSIMGQGNVVGSAELEDFNAIAANTSGGVRISGNAATGNWISAAFIGTDRTGTSAVANGGPGIRIEDGASFNTIGGSAFQVRNVVSGNSASGIHITGTAHDNVIKGNYIGTDGSGVGALANGGAGILIDGGASSNNIGDDIKFQLGNIIAGNTTHGVQIDGVTSTFNRLFANWIGLNAAGTAALPNLANGVFISGAQKTILGMGQAQGANFISGNGANGVELDGGAKGTAFNLNFIGTQADGKSALGNKGHGILITGDSTDNLIGGNIDGLVNVIAYNSLTGVTIRGTGSTGNAIRGGGTTGNSIYANAGLGIDLADDGVTANDPGDPDAGPNQRQNFPVLQVNGPGNFSGTLDSTPQTTFHVEVFASAAADASGYGEGQTPVWSDSVTTDENGLASFAIVPAQSVEGMYLTATATEPNGHTSEFSEAVLTSWFATGEEASDADPLQGEQVAFGGIGISPKTGNLRVAHGLPFTQGGDSCNCECEPNHPAMIDADGALVYNSASVHVRPILQARLASDPAGSVPTQIQVRLTWNNGTPQAPVTFATTGHQPGDVYLLGAQVAAPVTATGSYPWRLDIDVTLPGGQVLHRTVTGTARVVVTGSDGPFGPGWSLAGLDRLVAEADGVLWVHGTGGARWFAAGPNNTFVSPANDHGDLVRNPDGTYLYTDHHGTRWSFDAQGRLANVRHAHDEGPTLTWTNGLLTSLTATDGAVTTFHYTAGKLSSIDLPGNRTVTIGRNPAGDLASIIHPDASHRDFEYDGVHRMTRDHWSWRDVSFTWDPASGLLAGVDLGEDSTLGVQPAASQGLRTSPAISESAGVATFTDALDQDSTYRLDAAGRLLDQTTPDGATRSWQRNAAGQATLFTDPLGRQTASEYDEDGLELLRQVRPDGSDLEYEYDPVSHELTHVEDSLGNVTAIERDPATGDPLTVTDALGRETSLTWSTDGLLLSQTDPAGHTTELAYDSARRVILQTDPLGGETHFTFDDAGNLTVVEDPLGRETTRTYAVMGRVLTETDPLGGVRSWTYDELGQVLTTTDPLGHVTQYQYDARGLNTAITEAFGTPLARTTSMAYNALGWLTAQTDAAGNTTTFTHDPLGRVLTETDPLGAARESVYDDAGQLVTHIDPLGRETHYAYNERGWQTLVTSPLGNASTTTYDSEGRVLSRTDPLGHETQYAYDALGRVIQEIDPLGGVRTTAYDTAGNVASVTDELGNVTTFGYDGLNRRTTVTDALNHTTTTAFDAAGNVVSVTEPGNVTRTFTHDALNRLVAETDPLGHTTAYAHDLAGNRLSVTDPLGHTRTMAYDALNRLVSETDANGGVVAYGYDAVDNRTSLTDPVGNVWGFTFDDARRLVAETDPLQHARTSTYDLAGQLVETQDRNGRRRTYAYDDDGRRTAENWLDAQGTVIRTIGATYDDAGRVLAESDPDSALAYTYDAAGRVLTIDNQGTPGLPNVVLTQTWNAAGDRTSLADSLGGLVASTYDALHQLTSLALSVNSVPGPEVAFTHDERGQLTNLVRTIGGTGPSLTTALGHDAAGRLTGITHTSSAAGTLSAFAYGFDAASRVTSYTGPDGTLAYGYDDTDQLTSVTGSYNESYSYDLNGNRTMAGYVTGTGNRLLTDGTHNYEYDNEGNVTAQVRIVDSQRTEFTWDHRNRLEQALVKDAQGAVLAELQFTYDLQDRRLGAWTDLDGAGQQPAEEVWTLYDGVNPYADFDGTGNLLTRRLYTQAIDDLFARVVANGDVAWYLRDHLGSVRQLAETDGTVLDTIAYESFGTILSESNPANGDRFKYTSREYAGLLGTYFYRARWLGPTIGRFFGEDPSGFSPEDANLNRYVRNSPSNATDPTGLKILAPRQDVQGAHGAYPGADRFYALLETLGRQVGVPVPPNAWSLVTTQWHNVVEMRFQPAAEGTIHDILANYRQAADQAGLTDLLEAAITTKKRRMILFDATGQFGAMSLGIDPASPAGRFIPILGSIRSASNDFQNDDILSGSVNMTIGAAEPFIYLYCGKLIIEYGPRTAPWIGGMLAECNRRLRWKPPQAPNGTPFPPNGGSYKQPNPLPDSNWIRYGPDGKIIDGGPHLPKFDGPIAPRPPVPPEGPFPPPFSPN